MSGGRTAARPGGGPPLGERSSPPAHGAYACPPIICQCLPPHPLLQEAINSLEKKYKTEVPATAADTVQLAISTMQVGARPLAHLPEVP